MSNPLTYHFEQNFDYAYFQDCLQDPGDYMYLCYGLYFGFSKCCIKGFIQNLPRKYSNPLDGTGYILCKTCAKEYRQSPQEYKAKIKMQRYCEEPFLSSFQKEIPTEYVKYFFNLLKINPFDVLRFKKSFCHRFTDFIEVEPIYLICSNNKTTEIQRYDLTGYLLNNKKHLKDFLKTISNPQKHRNFWNQETSILFCHYFNEKFKAKTPLIFEEISTGIHYTFNAAEIELWLKQYNPDFIE